MKRINKLFGLTAIIFFFAACPSADNPPPDIVYKPYPKPSAGDFIISNLYQVRNNVNPVIIIPKPGKSGGAITIYYKGKDDTIYTKSKSVPQATGSYTVTFDVAAYEPNWGAVTDLSAGTLEVRDYNESESVYYDFCSTLDNLPVNTPDKPHTISLNLKSESILSDILAKIKSAGKYIILDLSGSTITTIPKDAFKNCTSLVGVTISDSITSIGAVAFYGCTSLAVVTIPNNVTSIGNEAFYGCTGLTGVTIGSGVTSIGERAFYGCTSLTGVTIGSGVTSIKSGSFSYCTSLTDITIPDNVTSIGEEAFFNCTGLTGVTIGSGVTSIGERTFFYCTGLTDITIPNSVTSIKSAVFSYCTSLAAINVDGGNSVYASEDGVLYKKNKNEIIQYPIGKKETIFTIPDSVVKIEERAFANCAGLTGIIIPNGVTGIGERAFFYCTGLTNIIIPSSVINIENEAFAGCTGLTNIIIPNSVTVIKEYTFADCTGLIGITIPNSVTVIKERAFAYCSGLISVTIPNSVTGIGNFTFYGCSDLTTVTFQGTIYQSGFSAYSSFPGDLRDKFYETDSTNGTPGTYTRSTGSNTWVMN